MISVAGFTSKGRGDIAMTDIFFTEEGGNLLCSVSAYNVHVHVI